MNDYKVTLILEGDPAEKGDVRLETFIGELAKFADIARKAEEIVSEGSTQSSMYYRISMTICFHLAAMWVGIH